MRGSGLLGKGVAIAATVFLLTLALMRIGFLVDERQAYQAQAEASVQQSSAGAQTLLGLVLARTCTEEWPQVVGEGRQRRVEKAGREFTLQLVPSRLQAQARSQTDLRHRGLFKVNGYVASFELRADWDDLSALQPRRLHEGSTLSCRRPVAWLALSDVRGVRSAALTQGTRELVVRPGTGHAGYSHGLQAEVEGDLPVEPPAPAAAPRPLALVLKLDLVGTTHLGLVPVAQQNRFDLQSDWPHPSFVGRFLPNERSVSAEGYRATWQVSALATSAPRTVQNEAARCLGAGAGEACLDSFLVAHVDPVNPYSLTDRAIKYGLLFVLLTFTAVGLAESLAGAAVRRVHPIQYALVGAALSLFFLLLLGLSEHLAFGIAYGAASAATAVLLGLYARHMLGQLRHGLWFGAGIALLYGLLYVLLLREQTALLLGSVGLFLALAAVMLLTRRVDWYGLAGKAAGARSTAAAAAASA